MQLSGSPLLGRVLTCPDDHSAVRDRASSKFGPFSTTEASVRSFVSAMVLSHVGESQQQQPEKASQLTPIVNLQLHTCRSL